MEENAWSFEQKKLYKIRKRVNQIFADSKRGNGTIESEKLVKSNLIGYIQTVHTDGWIDAKKHYNIKDKFGDEQLRWEDFQSATNSLILLMDNGLKQCFDPEYQAALLKSYHRMIDNREDLRI